MAIVVGMLRLTESGSELAESGWELTESGSELAESGWELHFIDACGSLERSDKGNQPQKGRHVEILRSGPGAVHIFQKVSVFTRGFPREPRGLFLFSQLGTRVFLENGALGSLKCGQNGFQECFF